MHLTISFKHGLHRFTLSFSVKSVQLMSEKRRIMNLFFKAPLFACLFFMAHLRVFLMIFRMFATKLQTCMPTWNY